MTVFFTDVWPLTHMCAIFKEPCDQYDIHQVFLPILCINMMVTFRNQWMPPTLSHKIMVSIWSFPPVLESWPNWCNHCIIVGFYHWWSSEAPSILSSACADHMTGHTQWTSQPNPCHMWSGSRHSVGVHSWSLFIFRGLLNLHELANDECCADTVKLLDVEIHPIFQPLR